MDGQEGEFILRGVPDGDYELVARSSLPGSNAQALAIRKMKVDADVTGLRIELRPLSSIKGVVQLQSDRVAPSPSCPSVKPLLQSEVVVAVGQERPAQQGVSQLSSAPTQTNSQVDENWQFALMNISEGVYRPVVGVTNPDWYLSSLRIAQPSTAANGRQRPGSSNDLVVSGIPVGPSTNVTGLVVTIASGAAGINGKVVGPGSAPLPKTVMITLVPAESVAANDVMRYSQVVTREGGVFVVRNIAPGRYWLLATPLLEGDAGFAGGLRSSYRNSAVRAQLRLEAEKTQKVFDLQPCQKLDGVVIEYAGR